MLPGPSVVIRCPRCKGTGCYATQISGNTFGGTYYTDGKAVFPMLEEIPQVVKCPSCSRPYWLSLAEEVGEFDRWGSDRAGSGGEPIDPALRHAPVLEEPTESEYLDALDDLIRANPDEETSLRIMAWWRGNDRYRAEPSEPIPPDSIRLSGLRRANIDVLSSRLSDGQDDDPNGKLMQAEILRLTGEFDRALDVLSGVFPDDYAAAVGRLSQLCRERDTAVRAFQ